MKKENDLIRPTVARTIGSLPLNTESFHSFYTHHISIINIKQALKPTTIPNFITTRTRCILDFAFDLFALDCSFIFRQFLPPHRSQLFCQDGSFEGNFATCKIISCNLL
ncbi:hypothetical protein QVD17_26485 [Tagetes erecta]|uniref:Uncharacterized protein n=1 Tax=Tagetes erecta TaxID=13708 RepID=A0AAD8K7H6_TARER|nr:hypothetical protein QVD17_26485 [Tagetes erecta]